MNKSVEERTVSAEQLAIRDLPRGWRGAPLGQMVASARQIVRQSQATGGSGDPRLEAALRVLEFIEREAKRK